jgi:hypothetical protein
MVKEHDNNGFFLPQNTYILDTFNDTEKKFREANQYSIFNLEGNLIQPVIELSSQYKDTTIEFENVTICKNYTDNLIGFRRYTICENKNTTIFFKIKHSEKNNNANYMLMYYLNETNDNYSFTLDEKFKIGFNESAQDKTNVNLTFNGINVKNLDILGIDFSITGTLYYSNESSFEFINSTCFLKERKVALVSEKVNSTYYNETKNSSSWTLVFKDVPRDPTYTNFIYDLRLQIKARAFNEFSKEEYFAYVVKVDLTEIKITKTKWIAWGIPVIVVGAILIIVLVFFIVKFLRLKKNNTNLQDEMVSLAFSNEIQKNVLIKNMELSKNESDYESTFI